MKKVVKVDVSFYVAAIGTIIKHEATEVTLLRNYRYPNTSTLVDGFIKHFTELGFNINYDNLFSFLTELETAILASIPELYSDVISYRTLEVTRFTNFQYLVLEVTYR